jgi:hypothetical protein
MENNTTKTVVFIAVAAVIGLVTYFIISGDDEINWNITFSPESKEPYGTYIVEKLVKESNQFSSYTFLEDSTYKEVKPDSPDFNNYVFIGGTYFAKSRDIDTLISYLQRGNNVFISAEEFDRDLTEALIENAAYDEFYEEPYEEENNESDISWDEYSDYEEDVQEEDQVEEIYDYENLPNVSIEYTNKVKITTTNPSLSTELNYIYEFDTLPYGWTYFNQDFINRFTGRRIEIIGELESLQNIGNEQPNLIKIQIGKGVVYLHSTPLLFTNLHQLKNENQEMAARLLGQLGGGKTYWADFNRKPHFDDVNNDYNDPSKPDESALEFILSEPSLRWAYYLALLGLVLYLIFGAKRKQRAIPVLPSMENTSIEYAEVVSQLFFKQQNHLKLIDLKMDLFKQHIRERYRIKTPSTKDEFEPFFIRLSTISGVPAEDIKWIFNKHITVQKELTADAITMVTFHKKLEEFYSNSR